MRQVSIWTLDRRLEKAKFGLWGDDHAGAATEVQRLTAWRSEISGWSDRKCDRVVAQLSKSLRIAMIQEAIQAEEEFAELLDAAFGKVSKAA